MNPHDTEKGRTVAIQRMISRRRLSGGVVGAATVAVLAACGAPATPTPPPKSAEKAVGATPAAAAGAKPKGPVTLRVAVNGTAQRAQDLNAFVKAFSDKNPGVTVEWSPIQAPDHDVFYVKLLTEIASGKQHDLVDIATEGVQLFADKLGLKLDDFLKSDKGAVQEYFSEVAPSLIEASMYEGSVYELPAGFNAAMVYLNVDALDKASIKPPADDWTVQEFREIARKLSAKKDASGQPEMFGYAWANRHWGGYVPWVFVNDSNLLTEERAPGGEWMWSTFYAGNAAAKGLGGGWRWNASKANDPKNIEALQVLVDMTKEKSALDPTSGVGQTATTANFVSGKIGMTVGGAGSVGAFKNGGMKEGSFDVRRFPKWKTQRHQFGARGLMGLKVSTAHDELYSFMKFWTSKDVIALVAGNPVTTTPPRRSMLTANVMFGMKNWRVFYETLDTLPDTAPIPAPPESNQLATVLVKAVDLAITGEQSPKQALDDMHRDLTKLFQARPKA